MIKLLSISISTLTGCLLTFQFVNIQQIERYWNTTFPPQEPGESEDDRGLSHRRVGGI